MTLDEAIRHCEDVANINERLCNTVHPAMQLSDYGKCAAEHRQLAEWLGKLKKIKQIIAQHDSEIMPDYWYIDRIREVVRED